jgi:hypothetical protein
MASVAEFRCEVCGIVSAHPTHWFVIRCNSTELTVIKWNTEAAVAKGARHYCGEAHAQVYIGRWLEAACAPPRPDFMGVADAQAGIYAEALVAFVHWIAGRYDQIRGQLSECQPSGSEE